MTKPSKRDYSKIDIRAVLEHRRQVAVIWDTGDVQNVRPDLNNDQAWEVLQFCRDNHDFEFGFNRGLIEIAAEMLFGDAPDSEIEEE